MSLLWPDERVDDLLKFAKQTYECEIPLAKEILHIKHFLFEFLMLFDGRCDTAKLRVTKQVTKVVFRWWHRDRTEAEEVVLPEAAAWRVFHEMRDVLDERCNQLEKMCNYDHNRPIVQ